MRKYRVNISKRNIVVFGILAIVYFSNVMFSRFNDPVKVGTVRNEAGKFAGSASCAGCHKSIYDSHIKTAHYADSRPSSRESIKGSFSPGKNKFVYNRWMEVLLERKKNAFYQTAYINGSAFQSERFDVVIGSGRKGQTYLYWNENKLYQLPVSYYTPLNSWCNSPGFTTNMVKFDRVIPAECLECHSTFAKVETGTDGQAVFDKARIIYGIDCERCHGAAANHVDFQTANPGIRTAKFITATKQLSRQQRLDACALCHSGFRTAIQPSFSFKAGDKLDDFSRVNYSSDSIAKLDVHGNQYGLLMASRCFRSSEKLDCSSCHNVHENEVNKTATFSQRCITCHNTVKHPGLAPPDMPLSNNCIDCHMPMLPSGKIVLSVSNVKDAVPDLVRTHRIAVYPDITREVLEKMSKHR